MLLAQSLLSNEKPKTLNINAKTTSKHVCRLQMSPRTFITLLLQHPKFLLLQHEGLLLLKGELQPEISLLYMKILTLIKAKSNVFL